MLTKSIFLASSSELKEDRNEFEIFINRKNKDWVSKGAFLRLEIWEDFLDAMSETRLQDEYNKAVRESDIFVMLFATKVGKYTEEEFEAAFGQFKATKKPFIFTYFKDTEISTGTANKSDLMSLWAFQDKLRALGHYPTVYNNIDQLKLHFSQQLDKLAANGFIEFKPDQGPDDLRRPSRGFAHFRPALRRSASQRSGRAGSLCARSDTHDRRQPSRRTICSRRESNSDHCRPHVEQSCARQVARHGDPRPRARPGAGSSGGARLHPSI